MPHELRTPLNAIIGFSQVLSERMFGDLNEKQEEYLKDIYASGTHLLSLINDILDLSKIEAGRMELELKDFDLPTALDSALALVRERAGRRAIALHLGVDERLGQVQADEQKIRQVVLNLLSNAIKFTPEGGRIEVTAVAKDGLVEVSVSDTGVGIAPEDQEAVFEEFRQVGTADKKVEGGLGLALSRKFVEPHGGRIWAKEPTRDTIVPGWIDTPMTEVALHGEAFMGKVLPRVPMRRWGVGDDFGGVAVYLASDASKYLCNSGGAITVSPCCFFDDFFPPPPPAGRVRRVLP